MFKNTKGELLCKLFFENYFRKHSLTDLMFLGKWCENLPV